MKEKIYIVKIGSGDYDDYHEFLQFATKCKTKAESWCARYNKIIKGERERLKNFKMKSDNQGLPYWHDKIVWDRPLAMIDEVELR